MKLKIDPSEKGKYSIADLAATDESCPNYYEEVMDLCEEIQAKAFDLPEEKVALITSMLTRFRDELTFGNNFN